MPYLRYIIYVCKHMLLDQSNFENKYILINLRTQMYTAPNAAIYLIHFTFLMLNLTGL